MTYNTKKEHAYEMFTNSMKNNDIPELMLLCGQEGYLIEWALELLKKKFVRPEFKDFDFNFIDCLEKNIEELIELATTVSFGSERKLIVVTNFFESKDKAKGKEDVEKIFKSVEGMAIIAFLFEGEIKPYEKSAMAKYIKENGEIFEFNIIDNSELKRFIQKKFKESNREISPEMLYYFIQNCGYLNKDNDYRLHDVLNDVKKIIDMGEGLVTKEEIIDGISKSLGESTFSLLDAISLNKKEEALILYKDIIMSGQSPFRLIASIAGQLELILMVKELKEKGLVKDEIAKKLKVHSFRVEKALGFARSFSEEKLRRMLINIYTCDKDIKSGRIDEKFAVEIFISSN